MKVLTLVASSLFLVIAGHLAKGKRFPTKSEYHLYLFNVSKYYQLLNFVILPGLFVGSIGSIADIFDAEKGKEFWDWNKFVKSFRVANGGDFLINLIITKIGIYFLIDALRLNNLVTYGNFSTRVVQDMWNKLSFNRWAQDEYYIFQMGSKNA